MKYRVREGAKWRNAVAGEVVEVEPHQAALVPWCLEALSDSAQSVAPLEQIVAPSVAPAGIAAPKSSKKTKS